MKVIKTSIEGLFCVENNAISDDRGTFSRFYCEKEFLELGITMPIVQINTSISLAKGTIRGLHYQKKPYAERKFVRCLQGSCYDVAVDLRENSPTYLQYFGIVLSTENNISIYIPEGFAHGCQALEDNTRIVYMVSEAYQPSAEGLVSYKDPLIQIQWPIENFILSEKDRNIPFLKYGDCF